ncbi:MAG: ABC transporter ATP-binding protein [Longispora sp.]|nr:ABC transporter ATP-binding protein [Longispora sp. (in: high G+C Gram-positive bacteria)]
MLYVPHADSVVDLISVTITRGGSRLIESIDWRIETHERWVVLGPNGAGKTTLLNLVGGRMHPSVGDATILGERLGTTDLAELRTRVGLTSATLADRIPADEKVHNVVVTAAWDVVGRFREDYGVMDDVRARVLLEQMGVAQLAERPYGTLSEGERKRVQIARALMVDPELLLLDEPAAGLDLGAREELVRRLAELAFDPDAPAMVLVTHHVEEIPPGFTHALLMRDGAVVAGGPIGDVIESEALSKAFGLPLAVEMRGGRYAARAL